MSARCLVLLIVCLMLSSFFSGCKLKPNVEEHREVVMTKREEDKKKSWGPLEVRRDARQKLANKESSREEKETAIQLLLEQPFEALPPNSGLEGFYPLEAVTPRFLKQRKIPLSPDVIHDAARRIGKLVIYNGSIPGAESDIRKEHRQYCTLPRRKVFNKIKCDAYEARKCRAGGLCTYDTFGNCSGFFLEKGFFVTAAHCVEPMLRDEKGLTKSKIEHYEWKNYEWIRTEYAINKGKVVSLKTTWDQQWVIPKPSPNDHLDVAVLRYEGGPELPSMKAVAPKAGRLVFTVGFPRVFGRPKAARLRVGYDNNYGELALSVGRVKDANPANAPLCSTTGRQDDWRIKADCSTGEGKDELDQPVATGLITSFPFLSDIDNINGYSGGALFDEQGQWAGINITIYGADPQEGYVDASHPVHIKSQEVLASLHKAGAFAPLTESETSSAAVGSK